MVPGTRRRVPGSRPAGVQPNCSNDRVERSFVYRRFRTGGDHCESVAPVAYQVILEPGIGQFREFELRRVHTRMNLWRLFLVLNLTCGKRESVS